MVTPREGVLKASVKPAIDKCPRTLSLGYGPMMELKCEGALDDHKLHWTIINDIKIMWQDNTPPKSDPLPSTISTQRPVKLSPQA